MEEKLNELTNELIRISEKMDSGKEVRDRIATDVQKIKEAVYNPDKGLYSRVRTLESFKSVSTKFLWIMASGLVALATTAVITKLF